MRIHFLVAKDILGGGGIETYTREVGPRLVGCLIHLPVGGHHFFSHQEAFSMRNWERVLLNFSAACS